jgi:hypothetical protein
MRKTSNCGAKRGKEEKWKEKWGNERNEGERQERRQRRENEEENIKLSKIEGKGK